MNPAAAGSISAEAARTAGASRTAEHARLRQAAEAFEAILVQSLIKKMREAQVPGGLFGEGAGTSVYEAMFDQHIAESISRGSPFGIADLLEQQWTREPEDRLEAFRALQVLERARDELAQVSGDPADKDK
jgi:Rod binding domain-containing protein